jgi:hypothetical protein
MLATPAFPHNSEVRETMRRVVWLVAQTAVMAGYVPATVTQILGCNSPGPIFVSGTIRSSRLAYRQLTQSVRKQTLEEGNQPPGRPTETASSPRRPYAQTTLKWSVVRVLPVKEAPVSQGIGLGCIPTSHACEVSPKGSVYLISIHNFGRLLKRRPTVSNSKVNLRIETSKT